MYGLQRNSQSFAFSSDDIQLIPRYGLVESRKKIKQTPFIYSAPMDMVTGPRLAQAMLNEKQHAVLSRFIDKDLYWSTIRSLSSKQNFWIAAGLNDIQDLISFRNNETPSEAFNICIDIAHGHSIQGIRAIKLLAANAGMFDGIMSGSICTPEAAFDCIAAGATHLRIGVSPGSMCSTAIATGFGLPLAYSVYTIAQALPPEMREQVTLIADGGIRSSGDAAKLMALGADGVMLGSELAWTKESHGWIQESADVFTKTYRGQASADFQKEVLDRDVACAEGVSTPKRAWDGFTSVNTVVNRYKDGLASACSYAGLNSIAELPTSNIPFVFVSSNGRQEAKPHGLT